jgi:hypothetical protein
VVKVRVKDALDHRRQLLQGVALLVEIRVPVIDAFDTGDGVAEALQGVSQTGVRRGRPH